MKSLTYALVLFAPSFPAVYAQECRCFPGDKCWPDDEEWAFFNTSVGGNLIQTVPLASACHDPQYDEAACAAVQADWTNPELHYKSSSSIMSGLWANQSCDPFTLREAQCVIGTYVQYAVNVSDADQVSKAVKFAKEKNIRFVVRNTGHDYIGKSTGAGAIAVWMHNLKSLEVLDWDRGYYTGPAIQAGAGVQGFEAIEFADGHDLVTVAGNCPTVGMAGGHIQGGGHSPLASKFGLAADNALEFEVVDGQGNILIANRKENRDLFWALSGGGGGTYGVVTRVTVKAHATFEVTTNTLAFAMSSVSDDIVRSALRSLHSVIPNLVDRGIYIINGFRGGYFTIQDLMAPGFTPGDVDELLEPFISYLNRTGVVYQRTVTSYPTFAEYYAKGGPSFYLNNQANNIQGGNWLIPRDIATDPTRDVEYIDAVLSVAASGATIGTVGFNVSEAVAGDVHNAVFEGWRRALFYTLFIVPDPSDETIAEGFQRLEMIDRDLVSKFRNIAPDGGSYLNEADPLNASWKKDFYGANYDKLLSIKNKYDSDHMFYGLTAVGSEYWVEKDDKRLCRATTAHCSTSYTDS
ncbi:hypothetical protein BKA67DRAFT_594693 [Truncatella angustata]|uniref:FAD-binding PCMH-type domain-containing protein n=1 Tax=Truncatella angustata TaxID=152316 RepID=A0A9P8RL06_9PEZI|nr:uncharacterized protein BKA67DRAFT_594693 [Truncatella angustata]KAH6647776.1 hypothetical protein BKA67DRAFT_594693 [Truncatella angustata]